MKDYLIMAAIIIALGVAIAKIAAPPIGYNWMPPPPPRKVSQKERRKKARYRRSQGIKVR